MSVSCLFLDTNLLGQLCNPNPIKYQEFKQWVYASMAASSQPFELFIPEIADYELRRKLIHLALKQGMETSSSLGYLDQYKEILNYSAITTGTLQLAAQLWAKYRHQGLSTAHPESLDGDVILAAQAIEKQGVVLTTNKKHLSRFVAVADWQDYLFPS